MHALVNQYGGLYSHSDKEAVQRHKALEMLESIHVFTAPAHAGLVEQYWRLGLGPGDVDTIPGWYDTELQELTCQVFKELFGGPYRGPTARRDFGYSLKTSADQLRDASRDFRRAFESGTGEHESTAVAMSFPRMPSRREYELISKPPLEVLETKAESGRVRVKLRVNDTGRFGRFLKEWDLEMDQASHTHAELFSLINRYYQARLAGGKTLGPPGPASKPENELLHAIRAFLPDVNLDDPPHAGWDSKHPWPGNGYMEHLLCDLAVAVGDDGKPPVKRLHGKMSLKLLETRAGFQKSQSGQAWLDIPIDNPGGASYRMRARLYTVDPREAEKRKRPVFKEFETVIVDASFGAKKGKRDRALKTHRENWPNGNPRIVYTYYDGEVPTVLPGGLKGSMPYPFKHGSFKSYHQDGTLKQSGQFQDDIRVGTWTENGTGKGFIGGLCTGAYANDKRQGPWKCCRPKDKAPLSEGVYINGRPEGRWVSYHSAGGVPPGRVSQVWTYKDGKRNGPYQEYDFQGRPRMSGQFRDDQMTGTWSYWKYEDDKDRKGTMRKKTYR